VLCLLWQLFSFPCLHVLLLHAVTPAGVCQFIKEEVAAGTPYRQIACLFRCFNMGGSKVYAPLLVRMSAMGQQGMEL